MKDLITMTLLITMCWTSAVSAQPADLERPVQLRVTGMLLPMEEQTRDDVVTVSIIVRDTPLLLRVGKIEELTRTERVQAVKWGILLRQVRFYGPDVFIGRLQQPETLGKPLTIDGQLDTRKRQFLVTAVTDATSTPSPPPAEQ